MGLTYEELLAYVETHAGIRAVVGLEPLAGPGAKVFPPTYGTDDRAPVTRYAVEERVLVDPDGAHSRRVESVVLNSVAAQAHQLSMALRDAWERNQLEIPLIGVDFTVAAGLEDIGILTDLDCPHRVYDAIVRDSLDGDVTFRFGPIGRSVTAASARNATALFLHAPAALLFGAWDSTGPKGGRGSKFERAIESEIVAMDIALGKKTSSRIDPLGIENVVEIYETADGWTLDRAEAPKGALRKKPTEINHGNSMRPSIDSTAGGVTASAITATTVLSLIQLRRLRFPTDANGNPFLNRDDAAAAAATARVTLAALGLAATALAFEAGFDLRSRCVLAPTSSLVFEAVGRTGDSDQFTLTGDDALRLVREAAERAKAAGFGWQADLHVLTPTGRLAELVRRSREAAEASSPSED